jgi:hypothetical protein
VTAGQSFETWVEDSRQAQGLPPRVEDEDTLLRVAGIVAAARRQNDRNHAAGRLPSRYVEDPAVLGKVADLSAEGGGRRGP